MHKSRQQSLKKYGKNLSFFITSNFFPSVSLTGSKCQLNCKHCGGKLLSHLISADLPEKLEETARRLAKSGAIGMLITGGCDTKGRVPTATVAESIRRIKQETDLIVIAHTGFVTPDEAYALADAGLDSIAFDVVGDSGTVRRVYGLKATRDDYLQSLEAISDAGIDVFPHVCVGLDFGTMRGELRALELIRQINPTTVVITGLMPIAGTPMSSIKPDPYDFAEVFCRARELFSEIPVTLGCAHSNGRDRELIELIALSCGVVHIAIPTRSFVRYAEAEGYTIEYFGTCCGILPRDATRIDGDLFQ
ncbi:MAG: radical SAM protein, partial [Euryarchaeota archaeon]|nr:radical SAM protein [Euryarchaeota archaeon]